MSYLLFHNVINVFRGDRSGLQAGQFSTQTLLLRSGVVVIFAEYGLALSWWNKQGFPEEDVVGMTAYVAPTPVYVV